MIFKVPSYPDASMINFEEAGSGICYPIQGDCKMKSDGKKSYEKRPFCTVYSHCGTHWTVECSLGQEVGSILKRFRQAQDQLNGNY